MQLSDCRTVAHYRQWTEERGWSVDIYRERWNEWQCRIRPANDRHAIFVDTYASTRIAAVRMACAAADAREGKR